MAKKAYTTAYFFVILLSLVLIIASYVLMGMLVNKYIDIISPYDLENYLLAYRVLYSKNSIFYTDKITGRTYTNLVDLERFNEQVINELLGSKINRDFGMSLTLDYNNIKKEIYVNKELYSSALTRHDIYSIFFISGIVKVKDNQQNYIGTLNLGITLKKK